MEEMQDHAYSNENNNNPKLLSSLQSLGLTNYESKAYLALLSLGICDARRLCTQSGVPSSKIYTIMEKFELLGLVEVQQSKPAKFKALEPSLAVDRLLKNREREILSIKDTLPLLESELDNIFSKHSDKSSASSDDPFFNLQFGMKNHIQKHLPYLANARVETLSYFETTCLLGAKVYGHSVKREIINNIQHNNMSSKVIFGTENRELVEGFLKGLPDSANIELKITKQIHAPFHVIDKKSAIVVVDNPLFHEGRIASIHAIGRSLAKELHEGYRSVGFSKGIIERESPIPPTPILYNRKISITLARVIIKRLLKILTCIKAGTIQPACRSIIMFYSASTENNRSVMGRFFSILQPIS